MKINIKKVKNIIIENQGNIESYIVILFVMITVVLLVVLWGTQRKRLGNNTIKNEYKEVNYEDVMKEYYETEAISLLSVSNLDALILKMDPEFMLKNNLDETNFKSYVLKNNFIGSNLSVISTTFFDFNIYKVYRIYYRNYNEYRYVNFIEQSPGVYIVSFDQKEVEKNGDFELKGFTDEIEYNIDLTDIRENEIKMNITITNISDLPMNINFNDINTFCLVNNNEKIKMSALTASDYNSISINGSITKELNFNVPYSYFVKCDGIEIRNIEFGNDGYIEKKDIFIRF